MIGSYCLCLDVGEETMAEVGALGTLVFSPGRYIYVGSALNGIEPRVRRHLRTNSGRPSSIHWHIDYLLRAPGIAVEAVYTQAADERTECDVASAISRRGDPIRGFGCSDCRCESHLFRVDSFDFLSEIGLNHHPLSGFGVISEHIK